MTPTEHESIKALDMVVGKSQPHGAGVDEWWGAVDWLRSGIRALLNECAEKDAALKQAKEIELMLRESWQSEMLAARAIEQRQIAEKDTEIQHLRALIALIVNKTPDGGTFTITLESPFLAELRRALSAQVPVGDAK